MCTYKLHSELSFTYLIRSLVRATLTYVVSKVYILVKKNIFKGKVISQNYIEF